MGGHHVWVWRECGWVACVCVCGHWYDITMLGLTFQLTPPVSVTSSPFPHLPVYIKTNLNYRDAEDRRAAAKVYV